MDKLERIQVVLASPSDLAEERKMIQKLVEEINSVCTRNGVYVDLRMWEKSVPGMHERGPQGVVDLDLEIPKADIFICLYWRKVGTIIPSEGIAGTEHELNIALESFQKSKKPDVKVFFKNIPSDASDTEDIVYIKGIARRLQPLGLYSIFDTLDDLRIKINQIIQSELMRKTRASTPIEPITSHHVEICSSKQLTANLLPGNRLLLEKGFYNILDFSQPTEYLEKRRVFDGEEAVLFGVSNLSIFGDMASILVRPRYATVLTMIRCENIKISGIAFGHVPQNGYCTGAVINLVDCNGIQFDSCEFFGCGTYGIVLDNCNNIIVNGSKIHRCTYGAINMNKSELKFVNSSIEECVDLIDNLVSTTGGYLYMNNVLIQGNSTKEYLFSLQELTDKQSSEYYAVPGIRNSFFLPTGVCVTDNHFKRLCNCDIPRNIYMDRNNL